MNNNNIEKALGTAYRLQFLQQLALNSDSGQVADFADCLGIYLSYLIEQLEAVSYLVSSNSQGHQP